MRNPAKAAVLIALAAAVGCIVVCKPSRAPTNAESPAHRQPASATAAEREGGKALPRLVEAGSDQCIPCKAMAPILAELRKNYAGLLRVDFIDVVKESEAAEELKVMVIPTQVFFDASGKERFRHEGFMPKADILAKWREIGVDLPEAPARPPSTNSKTKEEG